MVPSPNSLSISLFSKHVPAGLLAWLVLNGLGKIYLIICIILATFGTVVTDIFIAVRCCGKVYVYDPLGPLEDDEYSSLNAQIDGGLAATFSVLAIFLSIITGIVCSLV